MKRFDPMSMLRRMVWIIAIIGGLACYARAKPTADLIPEIGLALIVAGVIGLLHEYFFQRVEGPELAKNISDHVTKALIDILEPSGLHLVADQRTGYRGYHNWVGKLDFDKLFFAGRSVLHTIDNELRHDGKKSKPHASSPAVARIIERLEHGAAVKVMFLDPRCDLIRRIALEDKEDPTALLRNIATSIRLTCEIFTALHNNKKFHLEHTAELEVALYDHIPSFSYHAADGKIVVGFYFSGLGLKGCDTGPYEVMGEKTKGYFERHFQSLLDEAKSNGRLLLAINQRNQHRVLNHDLLAEVRNALRSELPNIDITQLIPEVPKD